MAGYRASPDEGAILSDINVTPLVDVTLVLLIIFMATASLIVNPAIKVDLPKATTGEDAGQTALTLGLDRAGKLYLNAQPATPDDVKRFIKGALEKKPDLQAVLGADHTVPHGRVVEIIDLLRASGVRRFAITVDQPRR